MRHGFVKVGTLLCAAATVVVGFAMHSIRDHRSAGASIYREFKAIELDPPPESWPNPEDFETEE